MSLLDPHVPQENLLKVHWSHTTLSLSNGKHVEGIIYQFLVDFLAWSNPNLSTLEPSTHVDTLSLLKDTQEDLFIISWWLLFGQSLKGRVRPTILAILEEISN